MAEGTTPEVLVREPGRALCHCRACQNPTTENYETRLVHRERHEEFAARYASQPTDRELGMWIALRTLSALSDTEPVGRGQCERPDHQMLPAHPSHIR